jgi:CBS domain-containing protein
MLNIPVEDGCELKLAPITVSKSDSATTLVEKMIVENVGAVIVVEEGRPIGIITEKDILDKIIKPLKDMEQTLAGDVMSKPLISLEFDHKMKEAMNLMRKHDIRRIVITKDGAFFGLVTERRFLEAAFLPLPTPLVPQELSLIKECLTHPRNGENNRKLVAFCSEPKTYSEMVARAGVRGDMFKVVVDLKKSGALAFADGKYFSTEQGLDALKSID